MVRIDKVNKIKNMKTNDRVGVPTRKDVSAMTEIVRAVDALCVDELIKSRCGGGNQR